MPDVVHVIDDDDGVRHALAILQDLRRLSNVRFARFLLPADQDQQPVVAAKV